MLRSVIFIPKAKKDLFMKTKNALASLLSLLALNSQVHAVNDFDWASTNYYDKKCEWRLEGCVTVDENEIDFRSTSKRMLDDIFSCLNTPQGCTNDQMIAIDEMRGMSSRTQLDITDVEGRGITGSELSSLLSKHELSELRQKGYFIPLNLSKKELLSFAAATSLGLVVFSNDQEIMDFVQENKTERTQRVADVANLFGREIIAPVAIGSYFLGVVFENGSLKDIGLITVTAGLATQLVTEGFKKSFKRVRPNGDEGPYEFGQTGNNSFFSGHTSGAFSLATVISETFKEDHKWVPYVAYGAAALTAYARMHDKKHWGSDVLAGAIAGHLVTKMVYRFHKKDENYESGFMVFPAYNPENGEFSVQVSFVGKRPKQAFKCEKMPQGPEKVSACIQEAFERSK